MEENVCSFWLLISDLSRSFIQYNQYCKQVIYKKNGSIVSIVRRQHIWKIEVKIKWGDGFVIVYSVTDSFDKVVCLCFLVNHIHSSSGARKCCPEPPPIVIVANKKDLEFDRMVSTEDGEGLSQGLKLSFHEISLRDGWEQTAGIFSVLYGDVIQQLDTSPASFCRRAVSKLMQKIPRIISNPPGRPDRSFGFSSFRDFLLD
uniref:small monomeric GTPase n=1 Tax=Oncorhynchus kisutch TaxID=8019 RepID=A0A8C7GSX4_ONCKI